MKKFLVLLLLTGCGAPAVECATGPLIGSRDCAGLEDLFLRSQAVFSLVSVTLRIPLRVVTEIDPSNSGRAYCRDGRVTVPSEWRNLVHELVHLADGCATPEHEQWVALGYVDAIEVLTGVYQVGFED